MIISQKDKYIIKDLLGNGAYGQVVKVQSQNSNQFFAAKVLKNNEIYTQQAFKEIRILKSLNTKFENSKHIVKLIDNFIFNMHVVIIFELLDLNLFQFIRRNNNEGLNINAIQILAKQILEGLNEIEQSGIVHVDLKPENLLFDEYLQDIKIIDFGASILKNEKVNHKAGTRYYRAPESILDNKYDNKSDMWAYGCILAEMYLGYQIFGGLSKYDMIKKISELLGMEKILEIDLNRCQRAHCFFIKEQDQFRLKTIEEYIITSGKKGEVVSRQYLNINNISELYSRRVWKFRTKPEIIAKEQYKRAAFVNFLEGIIQANPLKRWSSQVALLHPFITGEQFQGHWEPPVFDNFLQDQQVLQIAESCSYMEQKMLNSNCHKDINMTEAYTFQLFWNNFKQNIQNNDHISNQNVQSEANTQDNQVKYLKFEQNYQYLQLQTKNVQRIEQLLTYQFDLNKFAFRSVEPELNQQRKQNVHNYKSLQNIHSNQQLKFSPRSYKKGRKLYFTRNINYTKTNKKNNQLYKKKSQNNQTKNEYINSDQNSFSQLMEENQKFLQNQNQNSINNLLQATEIFQIQELKQNEKIMKDVQNQNQSSKSNNYYKNDIKKLPEIQFCNNEYEEEWKTYFRRIIESIYDLVRTW